MLPTLSKGQGVTVPALLLALIHKVRGRGNSRTSENAFMSSSRIGKTHAALSDPIHSGFILTSFRIHRCMFLYQR
jgi:hypothetical protein